MQENAKIEKLKWGLFGIFKYCAKLRYFWQFSNTLTNRRYTMLSSGMKPKIQTWHFWWFSISNTCGMAINDKNVWSFSRIRTWRKNPSRMKNSSIWNFKRKNPDLHLKSKGFKIQDSILSKFKFNKISVYLKMKWIKPWNPS